MAREKDREKFKELAEYRVNKTLNYIRLIGNLSNRSNYEYTDEDAAKIYKALNKALSEMKARFEAKGAEQEDTFKL